MKKNITQNSFNVAVCAVLLFITTFLLILRVRFRFFVNTMQRLPSSGSQRTYYRENIGESQTVIKTINSDKAENEAFINLSKHFLSKQIPVPQVYSVGEDKTQYTQQDLGDTSLFDYVKKGRESGLFSQEEQAMLNKTIRLLPHIQIEGAQGLDWSYCYPTDKWDGRVIGWDLNYFKYCFLKNMGCDFNEYLLDCDFETLSCELLQYRADFFLYRDFQSRNVMIYNGQPYLIDFQGGRHGPIYYDIVSFLWQSKLHLPTPLRLQLLQVYVEELNTISLCPNEYKQMSVDEHAKNITPFILFRILQTLGAYGYRGLIQKKLYFRDALSDGIANLNQFFTDYPNYINTCPYLYKMAATLVKTLSHKEERSKMLLITIYSFSYRDGVPEDVYGNGGGYVFDCRGLNNPGRETQYAHLTGTDAPVIRFIEEKSEMKTFLQGVFAIIDLHIANFFERGFTHLQIAFGCTGGQHRSVYAAEHTAQHVKQTFDVDVHLVHSELNTEKRL